MNFPLALVLILATLTLSTCDQTGNVCGDAKWKENLDLWQSHAMTDYDFVVKRFRDPNYSHVPFLIKVSNGETVYLESSRENAGLELTDGYGEVASGSKMFDMIRNACSNGTDVKVEYDKEFGYPTTINVPLQKEGVHSVDRYVIEKFNQVNS
ncbi:MAG: DUF6174 domain-containing protein, partial [Acidobacteriota bacterium]